LPDVEASRQIGDQMRVLSYPQLKPEKGIAYSRVHLNRLEREGKFPRRIRLSSNMVAWAEMELDAWLEARAAARDQPTTEAA
jgi:prophage regulatory protein